MKKSSFAGKLLIFLALAGVSVYFGVQIVRYFGDTLTTAVAYSYELDHTLELSGAVVRDERVLTDDGGGLMQLRRDEGERVSVGGVIAEVYADSASLERRDEIERLQNRISQLEYAQEAMLSAEASLKLDGQIEQTLLDYRTGVASGRLNVALDRGAKLRSLIIKRDYTYSGTEDLSGELRALEQELREAQSLSARSQRSIRAPQAGLYSAVTDGYESVLTPETLSSLTPSALSSLRPEAVAGNAVGKLILGENWYYAASVTSAEAADLQRRSGLRLRFTESDRALDVTLESVGAEENGRRVIVLRGKTYLQELTLLRRTGASLITETISGIRVPLSALRTAQKTVTAEDGTERKETVTGVYCVVGAESRFKPVNVLYSGDGFALVRSAYEGAETTKEQETLRLRQGDEVIVRGRNLFDGKVVI